MNGRIFTGAQARPYVDAIAIKGKRILAVGTNQEISSTAGPKTRRIDLAGHLVIPGINDAHVHFGADPIGTRVDFGGLAPTCARVLDVLEQAARKLPTGTLISGAIGPEAFFDPACTPAALDRVAPRRCSGAGFVEPTCRDFKPGRRKEIWRAHERSSAFGQLVRISDARTSGDRLHRNGCLCRVRRKQQREIGAGQAC